ncbi:MAG: PA14 domain-containing protein [Marinibacterium sp.]|nr:PA14 domain-containing protein [Marinibacterium sp.]
MKRGVFGVVSAVALMVAGACLAQPIELSPANPQPKGLKQGLAVEYAKARVRSIREARSALKKAKPGQPLSGLDYRDTSKGDPTLTAGRAFRVTANIDGYIKFPKAGIYELEFYSNDGIEARIDGKVVADHDGIHPCERTRIVEVSVPRAGYYPLDITYFQKEGTSCLMMKWAEKGKALTWTPNSAFGY